MRFGSLLVAVTTLAALVTPTLAAPAAAQADGGLGETPDTIWDVGNPDPNSRHTRQVRAIVRDIEEFNGYVYVAGKFRDVIAPDGGIQSQPYLARFDVDTGAWDPSFRPTVGGIVYAINITDDGRLYVGGEMPGGAMLFDARTGQQDEQFDPGLINSWGPPAVFDIEAVGDDVYLGGDFTEAQGESLSNLARVDGETGSLDREWLPTADLDTGTPLFAESLVFALAIDEPRDRVYVAGKFGGINGDDRASYFAVLDPEGGGLLPNLRQGLPKGIPNHRDGYSMWMEDVQFSADRVYVGGNGHQTMTMRASDLGLLNTFYTNTGVGQTTAGGDTQVIHVGESTVWSGCHCWGSVGPFQIGSYIRGEDGVMVVAEYDEWARDFATTNPFGQQPVNAGYGVDAQTNRLVPLTFDVAGQAGASAILEDSNGRLWMGGQFTKVRSTSRPVSGLIRLSAAAEPPEPDPVIVPPARTARPADDQILRLYRAVFGRAPDAQGFAFWTERYAEGEALGSIAGTFILSPEWNERYPAALSNTEYIDAIYQNVLGRAGDEDGVRFWLDALDSGRLSRVQVLLSVSESPENIEGTGTSQPLRIQEAQILRLYRAAFGRNPKPAAFSFWVRSLESGRTLDSIAAQFVDSTEWQRRFGAEPDNRELVRSLYQNVFDRAPDAQGFAYWLEQLDARSEASVLIAFSESIENVRRTGTPPA